ncbi:MAG TPA: hypothetical protein VE263_14920 [Candidatus Angelobacter sp.]|nr:hypothetical protein [Candidatus Angelobacter sp.]
MIPRTAKTYIAFVIASGTMLLILAVGWWSSTNLGQFALYLGLVALASALKVRIPGLEATVSPNFVFLLLAMVALPFSQIVAVSLAAALVQSLWRSAKRPRLVQVAFSIATLIVSSSAAYAFSHFVLNAVGMQSPVACAIVAGTIYFPLNSVLVSVVVGLVDGQPLRQVSQHCYEWVFPYFMGGIAFVGLISGAYIPSAIWKGALELIPAAALAHLYFLNRSGVPLPASLPVSSREEEEYPEEVHI